MVLLCALIVIVLWPDFVVAADFLRRIPEHRQIRRTARQECENLDGEYERLLRSYR